MITVTYIGLTFNWIQLFQYLRNSKYKGGIKVKRKSIYLLLCIILVFSLVTACGDKQATTPSGSSDNTDSQEVYTIDFAIHTSSGTNENKTLERFKELVEERSEGRIKINLYPDAVLGTELENLEQVKINEVQMSIFGDNLTGQLAPEFDPTIVPFIYKSVDDVYAVWKVDILLTLAVFLGVLIFLFIIGVSIPWAIGITSAIVLIMQNGITNIPYHTMVQKMTAGVNNFTLLAIPFFLLAGKLMNTGSITRKIFRFCNALVGWIPGGLGHANVLASIVFAGMSGSAVADASGLGTIEIEAMKNEGFDVEFSAAITAASSTIGPIIPPSIPLVVFGVAGGVSITKLLVSGIIPGLLMGIALMVMVYYYAIKRNYPRRKFPDLKEFFKLFKDAIFPLLTPIILIGGILSGIFTATEAAAVASLYAFILTYFVYKEMDMINTEMIAWRSEELMKEHVNSIPLKRIGQCNEVSEPVAFLCSDYASFITGYCMDINGGLYMD